MVAREFAERVHAGQLDRYGVPLWLREVSSATPEAAIADDRVASAAVR